MTKKAENGKSSADAPFYKNKTLSQTAKMQPVQEMERPPGCKERRINQKIHLSDYGQNSLKLP